jgi:hypothetical protein
VDQLLIGLSLAGPARLTVRRVAILLAPRSLSPRAGRGLG